MWCSLRFEMLDPPEDASTKTKRISPGEGGEFELGGFDAGTYEVTARYMLLPDDPEAMQFDEGRLEWHEPDAINALPIPETDRGVIWPLFWQHRGGFFAAHIDCTTDPMRWRLEQPASGGWQSL